MRMRKYSCRHIPTECKTKSSLLGSLAQPITKLEPMETKEILSKLDLIEEQARLTIDALPQLAKERQRMIVALVKQIRWQLTDSEPEALADPEATVRLSS
jgi:hypothetical protein